MLNANLNHREDLQARQVALESEKGEIYELAQKAHRREGDEYAETKERHFAFLIDLVTNWFPDRKVSLIQS
jgi:hypothetical protein